MGFGPDLEAAWRGAWAGLGGDGLVGEEAWAESSGAAGPRLPLCHRLRDDGSPPAALRGPRAAAPVEYRPASG